MCRIFDLIFIALGVIISIWGKTVIIYFLSENNDLSLIQDTEYVHSR